MTRVTSVTNVTGGVTCPDCPAPTLMLLLRDVDRFPNDVAMTRRSLSLHPSTSGSGDTD